VLLLRIVGLLSVIAIALGVGAWLVTGNRRYLMLSLRIFKWAVAAALLVFGLMALERLVVLV